MFLSASADLTLGRWVPYLAICSLLVIQLKANQSHSVPLLLPVFIAALGVANFSNYAYFWHLFTVPLLFFLTLSSPSPSFLYSRERHSLKFPDLSTWVVASCSGAWIATSLSRTRLGPTLDQWSFIQLAAVTVLLGALPRIYLNYWAPLHAKSNLKRAIYLALGCYIIIASLRTDVAESFGGSWFHTSYYVGPLLSIRNGGTLLWDVPAQYGLGPVVLSAFLPFESAHTAFFFAQALILTLSCSAAVASICRLGGSNALRAAMSIIFTLVFFNSDPALIGPTPYPSSSAMRFGPSLIVLAVLLIHHSERTPTRFSNRFLYPVIILAGLWSPESAFYTLSIVLVHVIREAAPLRAQKNFSCLKSATKQLSHLALSLLFFLGILCSYSLFRSGHLPDLHLLVVYVFEYGMGFGSVAIKHDSTGWLYLLIASILVSTTQSSKLSSEQRTSLYLLLAALLAWTSYFVGRAVPDNLLAQLPLLTFIAIQVVNVVIVGQKSISRTPFALRTVTIVPLQLIATLVVCLALNPNVATLGSSFKIASLSPDWSGSVPASPDLNFAMSVLPARARHSAIAFVGFSGLMPPLDGESIDLNQNQLWLPAPLTMLEEPFPDAVRRRVVERFLVHSPSDGLLVIDWSATTETRVAGWLSLLANHRQCNSLVVVNSIEIFECRAFTEA